MTRTRGTAAADFNHVVQMVLEQPVDGPFVLALAKHDYDTLEDVIGVSEADIELLTYDTPPEEGQDVGENQGPLSTQEDPHQDPPSLHAASF